MLGTRTKQVNSYGKRNHRIVNAADQPKVVLNVFDDVDAPPQWAPLASRMKKRENTVTKTGVLSPKTVRVHKKRHPSSTLQATTKEVRLIKQDKAKAQKSASRSAKASNPKNKLGATPTRTPLSPFPRNIPRSPPLSAKTRRGRVSSTNGISSLKPNKTLSPSIDIDIIVLDNDGKTVTKERRISRTGVQVNTLNQPVRNQLKAVSLPQKATLDNSVDDDLDLQPKRAARRAVVTVYSDDSDSEDESPSLPSSGSSRNILEVVVPAAPYGIHRNPKTPPPIAPEKCLVPSIPQPPVPLLAQKRYQHISSPVARPRQLTPIRRGPGKNFFEPHSPPSPSSTDFDLSLDLEELSLEASSLDNSYRPDHDIPLYLKPLLEECRQLENGPADFSSFIEAFAFDPILQSADRRPRDLSFRKIGEASYSEVFGVGDVVLKIIPLRDENVAGHTHTDDVDGPFPSDANDVLREIVVTRAMGEVCLGFVELLKTYIVRGKYPEVLLRLWDEYHETKGSESIRPDSFLVSQCYAIIILPNGGPDLEAYTFINPTKIGWRQASSLFWQVAKSLALAEQLVSFEHRDLHWGQVLVKNLPLTTVPPLKQKDQNARAGSNSVRLPMDDPSHGVRATLIDLGLARMDAGDGTGGERVHWTPFEDEVFMGEGDYQFDIYRIMKHYTGGDWEGFSPLTNVMWLHYLVSKLLHCKGLKAPSSRASPSLVEGMFMEKDCYNCLVDVERWLGSCVAAVSPTQIKRPKARGRPKKTQAPPPVQTEIFSGPSCAGEIVAYAVKKGWVQPVS